MSSPDSLLIVDKPAGWTSHDVVARCRRLAGTRRVGHAGTLDPMATGVLVLGINRGTKLLTYLVGADKTYSATVRLGQSTITDDAEGEVVSATELTERHRRELEAALPTAVADLTGAIKQVPSAVSAIKVDGKRSYARVRAGEAVELRARAVTVHDFRYGQLRPGPGGTLDLDVEVSVSSGTYVRALARDLGAALGVGGHLSALRRGSVGQFTLERAASLPTLESDGVASHLVPLADAAAEVFPVRRLDADQVRSLRYGQRIEAQVPGRAGPIAALGPEGNLVALLDERAAQARSLIVIPPDA